jgi:hypothetical protein
VKRYFNPKVKCEICKESPAHGILNYCYHDGGILRSELSCADCADGYVNQLRMRWDRSYEFDPFPIRKESPVNVEHYLGVGWVDKS